MADNGPFPDLAGQEEQRRYQFMIENICEIIWETDMKLVFSFVSAGVQSIAGYEPHEMVGKSLYDFLTLQSRKHLHDAYSNFEQQYRPEEVNPPIKLDMQLICKDGSPIWIHSRANVVEQNGTSVGFIGYSVDISERKVNEAKVQKYIADLEKTAVTDWLTGVYNRKKFDELMSLAIEKYKRYKRSFSTIMFDIDHFKRVNDELGHKTGDEVLVSLASLISRNIRKTDYLMRWGGEEFIVLMFETDMDEAGIMAEKLRSLVESHDFELDRQITISVGVTTYYEDEQMRQLITRLDRALLKAKKKGRNCCVVLGCDDRKLRNRDRSE